MQMITTLMISKFAFWRAISKILSTENQQLQFINNFEINKYGFNKDISFLSKYETFKHEG